MSDAKKLSAVGIKNLWHFSPDKVTAKVTGALVQTLLSDSDTVQVKNIHQDTWTLEEGEPSQDSYRNQLTGSVYRMGTKTMGEITINFTIGQYDYKLKADLLGGTATDTTWERPRGIVEIRRGFIVLTEDDQYVVFPLCNVSGREANTDGAIGIGVKGTVMEPENTAVSPEYWLDASEVVTGASEVVTGA